MLRAALVVVGSLSIMAGCSGGGGGGGYATGGHAGSGASGGASGSAGLAGQAGASGSAGSTPSCSGIELTTSGSLDLDAKSVLVSGVVRVNGNALPDTGGTRGAVWFESEATGDRLEIDLGSSGPGVYAARIAPGRYDVGFSGSSEACAASPSLPCNGAALSRDLDIQSDGALDLDVPVVVVQGAVTVNGQPMPPASGDRGALELRIEGGSSVSTPSFAASGAANYAMPLIAGKYEISWDGSASLCEGVVPSPVPCNDGPVASGVELVVSGVYDVDVRSVEIHGAVGVNGQSMPAAPGDRGALEFSLDSGGSLTTASLGASGPATYRVTLLAGKYDVEWDGNSSRCDGAVSAVPCNDAVVLSDIDLQTSGALDVNVPAVQISGAVTIDGQPMPAASEDRGALELRRQDGSSISTSSFGAGGPATYQITLVAGTYDVGWDGNSSLCSGAVSPVPCNDGVVLPAVTLTSSGALDVNVSAVQLSGVVLVNGQPMPPAASDRGALEFERDDGSTLATPDLGTSAPAVYQLTLLPGVYDVRWEGNSSACQEPGVSFPVPCNDGLVLEGIAVSSSGALDVNVPAITVGGVLRLDGQPLPPASSDRGTVSFAKLTGGSVESRSFATTGPSDYQLTLLPGRYVVQHDSISALCDPGSALSVPCIDQVLLGCP